MLVSPDERVPIARLLTFLEHGERMAHECAKAQAALSDDSGTRRFLLSQAKQEAMHARVFQGAIAWLAPKHLRDTPFLPALEEYRRILDDALARRDLTETFLAEQVVLKGLGEAVLTRIEQGLRGSLQAAPPDCFTRKKPIMGLAVARSNRRSSVVRPMCRISGNGRSGISR